jgi:hypothetical protein
MAGTGVGISLLMIAVGAILAIAVDYSVQGIDIVAIGVIGKTMTPTIDVHIEAAPKGERLTDRRRSDWTAVLTHLLDGSHWLPHRRTSRRARLTNVGRRGREAGAAAAPAFFVAAVPIPRLEYRFAISCAATSYGAFTAPR